MDISVRWPWMVLLILSTLILQASFYGAFSRGACSQTGDEILHVSSAETKDTSALKQQQYTASINEKPAKDTIQTEVGQSVQQDHADEHGEPQCVSVVYNKPAKTGSTTVGNLLQERFPEAKRVDCGVHNRNTSYIRLKEDKNSEFDIFDCHSALDPKMLSALTRQAAHPLALVTTIRHPVDQFISLFFHANKDTCGKGLPDAEGMRQFVKDYYYPRIQTFHSRPYQYEDLTEGIERIECSFWDVIWQTDELEEVLDTPVHSNSRSAKVCPEKGQIWKNTELMNIIRNATKKDVQLYENLLQCEKVTTEVPWVWNAKLGCIAEA